MLFKKRLPKPLRVILIILIGIYGIAGLCMWTYHLPERGEEQAEPFRGWLYYQDGPYRGKVVDADTGAPIEGAVMVGEWFLGIIAGIKDPMPFFCDARETVTDKNGEFILPRASCFNPWPFGFMYQPSFTIFKPGYDSYPPRLPIVTEMSTQEDWDAKRRYQLEHLVDLFTHTRNTVRLKKVDEIQDRRWILSGISLSSIPLNKIRYKVPRMMQLINEERGRFGLEPLYGGDK